MSPTLFLKAILAVLIVAGLILVLGAHAATQAPSLFVHDLLDWPAGDGIGPFSREARWFGAIAGGVSVALALLIWIIIVPEIAKGNRRAYIGTMAALGSWFILDSSGSIAAGVPANAVVNIILGAMLGIPLMLIFRNANLRENRSR